MWENTFEIARCGLGDTGCTLAENVKLFLPRQLEFGDERVQMIGLQDSTLVSSTMMMTMIMVINDDRPPR